MAEEHKVPLTSSKVKKHKTEKNEPRATENEVKELKHEVLATGLEDYGFWSELMQKECAERHEEERPFRRGRIWC